MDLVGRSFVLKLLLVVACIVAVGCSPKRETVSGNRDRATATAVDFADIELQAELSALSVETSITPEGLAQSLSRLSWISDDLKGELGEVLKGRETWYVYFRPTEEGTRGGDISVWVDLSGREVVHYIRWK